MEGSNTSSEITAGDVTISFDIGEGATGICTITVNDVDHPVNIENGIAKYIIPSASAGTYSVRASYEGDEHYEPYTSQNVTLQVGNGEGDFAKLKKLIDNASANSVITLNRNYTYTIGVDNITEGILINKKLKINGNGYTINALGQSRIFDISANNVELDNITLINAFMNGNYEGGGAVYWSGANGKVSNSIFKNNVIANNKGYGGAIYIAYGGYNLKVMNSNFINNTGYYGGALSWGNMWGAVDKNS